MNGFIFKWDNDEEFPLTKLFEGVDILKYRHINQGSEVYLCGKDGLCLWDVYKEKEFEFLLSNKEPYWIATNLIIDFVSNDYDENSHISRSEDNNFFGSLHINDGGSVVYFGFKDENILSVVRDNVKKYFEFGHDIIININDLMTW